MDSLLLPRRSRMRAAANLVLLLATVVALGGGVAALLGGCDNNTLVSVRKDTPAEVTRQPDGQMRTAAVSITPITSTGASSSGLAFSGDRLDVTCALSGGTVTLMAAAHDGTAWRVWQANPCALDSTTAARGSCSFPAMRATGLTWNVFKTGAGTASVCTAEGAYGPVTRNASSSGLSNVTVSSPLTGTGTAGDPVALGTVPASTGGTGQSTYAVGDLLVGAAGNNLTKLAIGASGRALVSNGTTAAWTVINTLPAPGTAGRVLYDDGSAWTSLAAGSSGQVLTSGGAGAPSWAWLSDRRVLFTNAVSLNGNFAQATTTATASAPYDARAVRVSGAGTVNFIVLTALRITGAGSVTVQIQGSTDGKTYSNISGAARTITTSISDSMSDTSGTISFNVSDGDWLIAKITGYSGTISSLSVVLVGGGGARLAQLLPANDNAHAQRLVA